MNINQITLASTDLRATKHFYQLLGCELIVDTPHYLRLACPNGGTSISFVLADKVESGTIIYFEHSELDRWYEELLLAGIEFTQAPTEQAYLFKEAELFDPSGNKLKLYWAGKNRLDPPWRVTHSERGAAE